MATMLIEGMEKGFAFLKLATASAAFFLAADIR
jgi:hypothetical protein